MSNSVYPDVETVPFSDGDVIEVTKRYKVIGIEPWNLGKGSYDVLTLEMIDGEPGGLVARWDGGIRGRDGTTLRVVDENGGE